ncbi:siderophore-interacting protein [Phytoactinopolyspora mesophila]|uniref:Siderophore-interacting protein n=1 Tax=Phytoactinopolyspora mesophila TaxID=2650750 RepID=A0A7K3M5F4_9ACTN|nr:siderophore-interacting protein [Phytoactinopolyspora mesophila]NDL58475.1 siderophore-interacting protein [Phytoactinopolyspora mesophila]
MTITATDADTSTSGTLTTDPDAPPWRPFRVVVAHLTRLSPAFLRITFTGDDLDQFGHDGPDQRIKLYVPRPGQSIPDFSPTDWYTQYRNSDPDVRGHIRTYTIRAVRPELRELDVDFVLHGHAGLGPVGPAASWAADARIGDELAVIGPNRVFPHDSRGHEWNPPPGARDLIIAGDETAVPAISGILETLRLAGTAARVRAFLEVPEPADVVELSAPGHSEITWLPRHRPDGTAVPHGQQLVDAVRSATFEAPAAARDDTSVVDTVDIDLEILWEVAASATSPVYAWVAGEAGAVKAIRRHLVRERGVDKGAVTFMGYWRLGRSLDE